MRSVGSEVLSLVVTLAIPACVIGAFPFGVFAFRATDGARCSPRASLVRLTPEAERVALRTARTSWQGRGNGARRLQADLFCAELPEDRRLSVLSVRDRCRPPSPPSPACEWTPFLPSLQAPPPSPIKADPMTESLPFPREELLKLN